MNNFRRQSCLGFQRPSPRVWGWALMMMMAAGNLFGANGTTTGTFTTRALWDTIHCYAAFSADDNGNNSAVIEWRESGGSWNTAFDPYEDHRLTVGAFDNAFSNTCRTVIFGLKQNTSYDVKVTFSDSDGVSGSNPITNTVTTKRFDVPTNGTVIAVSDDTGLVNAVTSTANPGDTIEVAAGTYKPFNWTRNGNASGWIVMQPASGATVNVKGTNDVNIDLNARFVKITGLKFPESHTSTIRWADGQSNVIVHACDMMDVNTTANASDPAGFDVPNGDTVFDAAIISCNMTGKVMVTQYYGVTMGNGAGFSHGFYIASNNIIGPFYDGIGGGGVTEGRGFYKDWVCAWNNIRDSDDDWIEVDGPGCNSLLLGNNCWSSNQITRAGLSMAPVWTGPLFVIGNRGRGTNMETSVLKQGDPTSNFVDGGPILLAHNSWSQKYSTSGGRHISSQGGGTADTNTHSRLRTYWNNVFESYNGTIDNDGNVSPRLNAFNYNCYTNAASPTGNLQQDFDDVDSNDYTTIAAFNAAQGEEANGIFADPKWADYETMALASDSPCRNTGRIITGINDFPGSPLLYQGSAPDMGAMEFQEAPGNPAVQPVRAKMRNAVGSFGR